MAEGWLAGVPVAEWKCSVSGVGAGSMAPVPQEERSPTRSTQRRSLSVRRHARLSAGWSPAGSRAVTCEPSSAPRFCAGAPSSLSFHKFVQDSCAMTDTNEDAHRHLADDTRFRPLKRTARAVLLHRSRNRTGSMAEPGGGSREESGAREGGDAERGRRSRAE